MTPLADQPLLWDAGTGHWDGPRLRLAIVARGLTPAEFADRAGLKIEVLARGLRSGRVRDKHTIQIFRELERHEVNAAVYGGG